MITGEYWCLLFRRAISICKKGKFIKKNNYDKDKIKRGTQ